VTCQPTAGGEAEDTGGALAPFLPGVSKNKVFWGA